MSLIQGNLAKLEKTHQEFENYLQDCSAEIFQKYLYLKNNFDEIDEIEKSDTLIEVSLFLEKFIANLFQIKLDDKKQQYQEINFIYDIKRNFIQRKLIRKSIDFSAFKEESFLHKIPKEKKQNHHDLELYICQKIKFFLQNPLENSDEFQQIQQYCVKNIQNPSQIHQDGILFNLPQKTNWENLLEIQQTSSGELQALEKNLHPRNNFELSDHGCNLSQAIDQTNYCIICHKQKKDSCAQGLKDREQNFKKDIFDNNLFGCPLEQKISEMNFLKRGGFDISALAMVVIDNPMVAATGHRICNDCMKSCIYQKQSPVDVPQIESKILKDVLDLPYGFEIYALLTKWNPLNIKNPLPKTNSGKKVMIAGLGPAGFTLAHYLLQQGHLVVAIDGLKIEPLDPKISGIDQQGKRHQFQPIKDIKDIYENLADRPAYGFGGVAEYGITARWDKNYLKIIRLLLERRENFQMFGSFRLGSAFDCQDLLTDYGFDHVALCLGAGWPNNLHIKNNFSKGVRFASDFLMSLQLTGADKINSISNLQIRLPAIVVGAGLTATDAACEIMPYYTVQVKKFYQRYKNLKQQNPNVAHGWSEEEKTIAHEFISHAEEISKAKNKNEILQLIKKWGGVKIVYRKKISQSPAYQKNHEELQKALNEGIEFIENSNPIAVINDKFNHIQALQIEKNGSMTEMPAKSLIIAIGTAPNKAPFYEDKAEFKLKNNTFQIKDLVGNDFEQDLDLKSQKEKHFIASILKTQKAVSFFGDLHPVFSGSVVKAMASAKYGSKKIAQILSNLPATKTNYHEFQKDLQQKFLVKIHQIQQISTNSTELIIKAPALAQKTKIGHIFRLQSYGSKKEKNMESIPVTAYAVDQKQGLIKTVVVGVGASSNLVKDFKEGQIINFMGPSGSPMYLHQNKTILLIAGSRGIFPLAAMAKTYRQNGCKVILCCGYKKIEHISRLSFLKKSCDQLIIAIEEKSADYFHGNLIEAVRNFAKSSEIVKDIDVIFAMGNDNMMHEVAKLKYQLKEKLNFNHIGISSLNNPMSCMLKGVCGQCLQRKIKDGKEIFFFSCISQDQKNDEIDFQFLKNRCQQNSLLEKI